MNSVWAQNFIVTETGDWSTLEIHCMPTGTNYSTYHVRFNEDTVIDSKTYKKAWFTEDENLEDWMLYGFIREDTLHKVYIRPPDYIDGLIYDFGVELGDTVKALNVYLNPDTLSFLVTAIDSVMLMDRYRKRVTLNEYINQKEEIWIEGLGSLYGVLNSCNNAYGGACGGYEALCYLEEGEIIFQNPAYNTCHYMLTVGTDIQFQNEVKIFPNPSNGNVVIDFNKDKNIKADRMLKLYDLTGREKYRQMLWLERNAIRLPEIGKGLFLLQIIQSGEVIYSAKLLLE